MVKGASLCSSLSETNEENMSIADDYALTIATSGRVDCNNGLITNVYHVSNINSTNLLSIPHLIQTGKKFKFYPKTLC
jgi:hypothetical protein